MELFVEQLLNGLGAGAMYALITLGLALIYGVMKILHVAHASVYTAGAYMGLYIFLSTGSVLIAVIVSMAFCSLLGVLIERYIYYPLLKYPPYVPLISSIALLIAIEERAPFSLCRGLRRNDLVHAHGRLLPHRGDPHRALAADD